MPKQPVNPNGYISIRSTRKQWRRIVSKLNFYMFIQLNKCKIKPRWIHGRRNIYLFTDIFNGRAQKLNKNWDSSMINNNPCVLWCPRSNICESPSSLKLNIRDFFYFFILLKRQDKDDTKICGKQYINEFKAQIEQSRAQIRTWSCGKSSLARNFTNWGTTPDCITSSIGGLRSGPKLKMWEL